MKTTILLLALLTGSGVTPAPAAKPEKPLETVEVLPPMTVKGEVQCSFGFGVRMMRQAGTTRVLRLFLTRVHPSSDAARFKLGPGDEILSLNGEKVRGMDGAAKQGAKLFSLLCDRAPGDTIEAEVLTQDEVRRVTLRAGKR